LSSALTFFEGIAVRPTIAVVIGVFALSLMCLGCGPSGPEIAKVEGTVTLDGEPLPNASVVFVPENGRPAGGRTDAQGKYVLNFTQGREGAIPGKSKVRISTAAEASETPEGQPIPATPEKIPAKYNAATELEVVVEPGKANVHDFALQSGGPVLGEDTSVKESRLCE
jgi:hypothetical protein